MTHVVVIDMGDFDQIIEDNSFKTKYAAKRWCKSAMRHSRYKLEIKKPGDIRRLHSFYQCDDVLVEMTVD